MADNLSYGAATARAWPFAQEAIQKATVGDFEGAESELWNAASAFHGIGGDGKSVIGPRDARVDWMVAGWVSMVDRAREKSVAEEKKERDAQLAEIFAEYSYPALKLVTTKEIAVPVSIEEQIWAGGCGPGVTRPSEADTRSWQALRAPIQGVSVSYAVIHFAGKAGISQDEAEAVLANLKPTEGHRTNALLAERVFARFAKENDITVNSAKTVMCAWAEGRE
jgi:hypothetical protein